jgi:transcriptional regulator with XRE-family HTH domain
MHRIIVKKIEMLRREKGLTSKDMADKLNIDHSAYTRLESAKTLTWAKYIEEILPILDISMEDFFGGLGENTNVFNEKGSILGYNGKVEHLYAENKEKQEKIDKLNEARLADKDLIIKDKETLIQELKDIIAILKNKTMQN